MLSEPWHTAVVKAMQAMTGVEYPPVSPEALELAASVQMLKNPSSQWIDGVPVAQGIWDCAFQTVQDGPWIVLRCLVKPPIVGEGPMTYECGMTRVNVPDVFCVMHMPDPPLPDAPQ